MAAACAVCLQLLAKGGPFRLVGCEVVHPHCLDRIEASRQNVMAAKIVQLTNDIARERSEAARHRVERDNAVSETRLARQARDTALASVRAIDDLLRAAVRNAQDALGDVRAAQRQRDEMRAERDNAQTELRLHQTIGAAPARATTTPAKTEDRDDTEIRFSLLELDTTPKIGDLDAATETEKNATDEQGQGAHSPP